MKKSFTILFGLLPAFIWGALCDDTYYLQSITQTTHSGSNPRTFENHVVKEIPASLEGLSRLNVAMDYTFLSEFTGACTKGPTTLHFKSLKSTKTSFTDSIDANYQIQMFDTNTQINGFKFPYWFAFYKPTESIDFFMGIESLTHKTFSIFYAALYYSDSTRSTESGLWSKSTGRYYHLNGPVDSVTVDKGLLDATGVRSAIIDENHKGFYSIQFLKIIYANQKPTAIFKNKSKASNFQATQMGESVLIQSKNDQVGIHSISLFDMLGNKINTLHSIGSEYQWNGRSAAGNYASTGVYFIQAGNKVLGKFFYSR